MPDEYCDIVTQADFTLYVEDGASPPNRLELTAWGTVGYAPGGWQLKEIENPDGTHSRVHRPRRVKENKTTLNITARQEGGAGAVNTGIATVPFVITHSAGKTYVVELDITDTTLGETEPTRVWVEWSAGADAAATDTAAIAALEAAIAAGAAPIATPTGTVTKIFPAGIVVRTVSVGQGTGTVTAVVGYTGGTVVGETELQDLVNHSGPYNRWVCTTNPNDNCNRTEKTFTWGIIFGGKDHRFEACTHTGSFSPSLEQIEISLDIESRRPYPRIIDYVAA